MFRITMMIGLVLLRMSLFGQQLYQVSYSGSSTLTSFSIITDQQVIIRISPDGQVIEWGLEWERYRYNYYPGKLQPYPGRIDYYGLEADSIMRGKIKSIGTSFFSYYGMYETEDRRGKLRSIGTALMDYYTNFDNKALRGKLKWIGNVQLNYYSDFDNEAYRGKLRSVGNTAITYYSSFDEKMRVGKIKTLGNLKYTWKDDRGFDSNWQSNLMAPVINGVMYIIL